MPGVLICVHGNFFAFEILSAGVTAPAREGLSGQEAQAQVFSDDRLRFSLGGSAEHLRTPRGGVTVFV